LLTWQGIEINMFMRKVLLFTLLMLVAKVGLCQEVNDTTGLYSSGMQHISTGDYAGAVRDFNGIIHLAPGNPEALAGRALARYYLGDLTSARADIDKVTLTKPALALGHYVSGLVFMAEKKYVDAVGQLDKALDINSSYTDALCAKFLCMHATGKTKEAYELADKAVTSNPNEAAYLYTRGLLWMFRDKMEKALKDFDNAQKVNPSYNKFNVLISRGNAYMGLQEYDRAVSDLTDAIAVNPDNATVYQIRGLAYYQKQDYTSAVTDFNHSIQINPDNASSHFNLGMAYIKQEDKKNACMHFRISCELQNKNACRMVMMECTGN
jgi:tetratricopeptide (TPR) repeat protein